MSSRVCRCNRSAATSAPACAGATCGFVFQGFNLLARTSAQENVELPLVYRGEPSAPRHAMAARALEQVGLKGWEHHTPGELSGGQQQRVAIARAIVTEPAVLLGRRTHRQPRHRPQQGNHGPALAPERRPGHHRAMVTHEAEMAAYARRIVRFVDGVVESDERNPRPGRAPGGTRCHGHGSGLTMWLNTLLLALRSIRRNLMRSFLTILGIVIGVSAVITMVTVGNGATLSVQKPDLGAGHQPLADPTGPAHGSGQRRLQRARLQGQRRRGDRHPDRRRRGRGTRNRARAARWWPTAATGPAPSPAAPTTG